MSKQVSSVKAQERYWHGNTQCSNGKEEEEKEKKREKIKEEGIRRGKERMGIKGKGGGSKSHHLYPESLQQVPDTSSP